VEPSLWVPVRTNHTTSCIRGGFRSGVVGPAGGWPVHTQQWPSVTEVRGDGNRVEFYAYFASFVIHCSILGVCSVVGHLDR